MAGASRRALSSPGFPVSPSPAGAAAGAERPWGVSVPATSLLSGSPCSHAGSGSPLGGGDLGPPRKGESVCAQSPGGFLTRLQSPPLLPPQPRLLLALSP